MMILIISLLLFLSMKIFLHLFSDQNEEKYKIDIEIIPTNGHISDFAHPPKIALIQEDSQIFRSQSVGNRSYLKQANTNDTQGFLSESLLNNIKFGKKSESRSLGDVYRYSSGTLARPDIFYQVHKKRHPYNEIEMISIQLIHNFCSD